MTNPANKVAIITGSTSGIGSAIAHQLSAAGAYVVINSVSSIDKGQQLAAKLNNAIYVQGNIGNEEDCNRLAKQTVEHYGSIDILINNAGRSISHSNDALAISNQDFLDTLNLNVVGTWCLTREALPFLKQSGDGNILNITACSGIDPAQAASGIHYAVAKAAINQLTKFLAKHCGPEVRANAIAPGGVILTERAKQFPEIVKQISEKTPLKRVGIPDDIAELVLAIIKSNYINGEIIMADGGFSVL